MQMRVDRNAGKKAMVMVSAVVLLAAAVALSACSGNGGSSETGEGSETTSAPAPIKWTPESDCSVCHQAEGDSVADTALLASTHSAQKCVNCHSDIDALATLHANATGAPSEEQAAQMRKNARSMATKEFCLTCHGSLEELAAKTAAGTALKDLNGTVVNPHAVPASAKHDAGNVDECFSCHKIHKASPAVGASCASCHHKNVFECGTCHEVAE